VHPARIHLRLGDHYNPGVDYMVMVYRPKVDPKLAFVLMPFKQPFKDYYEDIIKPAAKAAGLEARKADEIYGTGPIIHDIWSHIWKASVVIADVTEKNPNVNYELGICHALGVPTVIIAQSIDDVPFDYQHRRCIVYETSGSVWQRELKKAITATLKKVLEGEDVVPELTWPYDTSPFRENDHGSSLIAATSGRERVIRGTRMVRDALASAFGPNGMSISINVAHGRNVFHKKGTAIASSIRSSEPLEIAGIDHARGVASEMRDSVGDGSKTAVLLFQRMLESGCLALKRNHQLRDLLRGMERGTEAVVFAIRSQSKPITRESLLHVAKTAAGGNAILAKLVTEAYEKAGINGIVVVEQTNQLESSLETQEGMVFDRGYLDTELLASTETSECNLEDSYILIYDRKISSMRDLLPLLEQVASSKRPLLIIAEDVEGEALSTILVNRKKGTLDCVAVRAPGYGDRRRAILQDIAVITGGTSVTLASGRALASVALKDLGRARKVLVTKESTTILGGAGEPNVPKHIETIREELARATDPFTIEKLRERLARLGGAIASVRIGGISPEEVADRAYYAESSMHSGQSAIEEGTVPGGGASLLQAKPSLSKISLKRSGEKAGIAVIAEALDEPMRQLVINHRMGDPAGVLKRAGRSNGKGFNSDNGKVEDLAAVGIIDPAATVSRAVQLAFAHARTLLETGAWDSTDHRAQTQPHDSVENVLEANIADSKPPET
jgi:chaperonin GroEL